MKIDIGKITRVVSNVAGTAVHLTRQTTSLGWIAAGAQVVAAVTKEFRSEDDPTDGWGHLDLEFGSQFKEVLAREFPMESHSLEAFDVEIFDVKGTKLGWRIYSWGTWGPFVPRGEEAGIRSMLAELLWSKSKVWRWDRTPMGASVLVGEKGMDFDSQLSRDLWGGIEKFLDAGHCRAVLLHGEVGTGKSGVANNIGKLSGGRVIRIPSRTMHKVGDVLKGLALMNPSVVLVDDIDRADPQGILDIVDSLKSVSLFLATANNLKKLDAGVYRRFDADHEVTVLPEVAKRLLGDAPAEVRDLPVVYQHEYARIREVYGEDCQGHVDELVRRREFASNLEGSGADEKCTAKATD